MQSADREALQMLSPLLARLVEASARSKRLASSRYREPRSCRGWRAARHSFSTGTSRC
jgi:hypothetical protein